MVRDNCYEILFKSPDRGIYRPPSSDIDYLKELDRSLSLIERSGNYLSILLLGDFNLPQIVWSTPSPTCPDSLSSTFFAIIADYFLHQLVFQPNREQNILDLVFITAPELVKDLEICQPVGGSDHCSIEFNLKLKFQRPERSCRLVYNYRAAGWLGLREDFCNCNGTVHILWRLWMMSGMLGKYYFTKRSNVIFHQNNLNLSATHRG